MPTGTADGTRALDEQELDELVMPTFDGVGHDGRWLASVSKRAPAYADVLKAAVERF
jgi:hypothetical protein